MTLGGALVENIICLLAYNDQYAPIIRNSVELRLYGGPYRILAARIYDYIDRFKAPPKDHLPDILEDKLSSGDAESKLYKNIVLNIRNAQDGLNTEYIVHKLEIFIKRQSLRSVSVDLTKALQQDTEESLEQADRLISQSRHQALQLFDPGTRLSDKAKALNFLDIGNECFPTGIKDLDIRGFGPTRKEMLMLIAPAKMGKSFWLTHLAKMAIINRLKVAHITLEMSEGRCSQRYFQTLYSIAKRKDIGNSIRFKKDDQGRILSFDEVKITPKHTLQDHDIREKLEKIIDKWALRQLDNIFIKEFPTGSLSANGLEAYLDNLEVTQQFVPDLVVLDYPDLMELEGSEHRFALDTLFKDLRGRIAVQRNVALAVVSQSNRSGAKAKTVEGTDVAEAWNKVQHADTIITLSATAAEKRLGLARMYVAGGRNDEGHITLVISQHYRTGSFVIDTALMSNDYWSNLPTEGGGET